jgi:hypothetical protein
MFRSSSGLLSEKGRILAGMRHLSLGTKLTLGFVALLAILLAIGVESISLLDRLGGSIDVILRETTKVSSPASR